METPTYRLVTLVAERSVRDRLLDALHALGATGHTIHDVHVEGVRGASASHQDRPSVKIETVVRPDVAERIVAHVAERYLRHHAVLLYVQDVEVVSGSTYTPRSAPAA